MSNDAPGCLIFARAGDFMRSTGADKGVQPVSGQIGSTKLKGEHKGYEYTWITLPPIRDEQYGIQVRSAVNSLRHSIGLFAGGALPNETGNEIDDKAATLWNERIESAGTVLDMIDDGQELNFSYQCFGATVGIICIKPRSFYISELVTHPAVANAGEILIEEACNRSQLAGLDGKLSLSSLNELSTGFYLSIGFVKTDGDRKTGGSMTFDPKGNQYWVRLSGRWVLIKYAGMCYYKGTKTPPPIPTKPNITKIN
jgi:hypothetical protein